MSPSPRPKKRPDSADHRAYQAFIVPLKDKFLLSLRDGAWRKVAEVALWLAPRVEVEIAVQRFLAAGGTHEKKLEEKAGKGHALILRDILHDLRRKKLLAVRNSEAGEEEVRVAPLSDDRFDIDPELENLLPRAPDEVKKLEERLLAEGQRDPLVVWRGHRLLVDGHTRFRLLSLLGRICEVVEMDFPDRAAVVAWMYATHYGRRSFSAEMKSYARGKEYLARKQLHGGARQRASSARQNLKTAEVVAAEYGVGKSAVLSDAAFAVAVDRLAAICGQDVQQKVLARAVHWTRGDVLRLAKLGEGELREVVRVALKYDKRPEFQAKGGKQPARASVSFPLDEPLEQVRALKKALGGMRLARLHKALAQYLERREQAKQG